MAGWFECRPLGSFGCTASCRPERDVVETLPARECGFAEHACTNRCADDLTGQGHINRKREPGHAPGQTVLIAGRLLAQLNCVSPEHESSAYRQDAVENEAPMEPARPGGDGSLIMLNQGSRCVEVCLELSDNKSKTPNVPDAVTRKRAENVPPGRGTQNRPKVTKTTVNRVSPGFRVVSRRWSWMRRLDTCRPG